MFLGVVKQKARKKINGYIGIADTKTKRPDKKKKKKLITLPTNQTVYTHLSPIELAVERRL